MTVMTTLGAVFTPFNPPERLRSVARAADEAGLEQLWLWEDCFREAGISTLAAALAWTDQLRVGIGVLPFPLRNVALTAMEVASIERMFPGRAIVGIGHGVQDWMAQVGVRASSPLTLMREYTTALSALLRGERVTADGRYVHLDDVALDWPPAVAPAIHVAATGPKTLRLAGEIAGGTVLSGGTDPDGVRAAVAHINADSFHEVTVYLQVATGPDAAQRLAAQAEYFGEEDRFSVAGDAREIADVVIQLAEAGATAVILQPPADEPDPESFVRFTATEVRSLVP